MQVQLWIYTTSDICKFSQFNKPLGESNFKEFSNIMSIVNP